MKIQLVLLGTLIGTLSFCEERWLNIPYPMNRWGVSVLRVNQTEKGDVVRASGNLGNNIGFEFENPESLKVKADVNMVKVDYFLLPFLTVYGIGGNLDATAKFKLGKPRIELGDDKLSNAIENGINKKLPKLEISQKAEGYLYGGGILLAFEYKNIFTSVQYTYTEIQMKDNMATKKAEVMNGRVGYTLRPSKNYTITPYIGVAYQQTDSTITGTIPKTNASYSFEMNLDEVNPSAGIFMTLPKNLTLLIETGWGNKKLIAVDLGWRF